MLSDHHQWVYSPFFVAKKKMESALGELETKRFCQIRDVVERGKPDYHEQH